jgi:hypothetical protein
MRKRLRTDGCNAQPGWSVLAGSMKYERNAVAASVTEPSMVNLSKFETAGRSNPETLRLGHT